MATPAISYGVSMNTLKSRILNPAQTSIYSVLINLPTTKGGGDKQTLAEYIKTEFGMIYDPQLMELTCVEASLPGSSLATIETLDYTGITEKHAYRRLYDDGIDFTFLVTQDSGYQQIKFFDSWIRYIVRESESRDIQSDKFYARIRYPKDYQARMQIIKYERNLGSGFIGSVPMLLYNFVGAYPKSINSIPVSYDASDLLKVTVSFAYTRYYIDKQVVVVDTASQQNNSNSPGNPEVPRINLNSPVIQDVNGRSFPLGTGIPGLTGDLYPTTA